MRYLVICQDAKANESSMRRFPAKHKRSGGTLSHSTILSHQSCVITDPLLLAFRLTSENALSASISQWLIQTSSLQACQNDSHFEFSSDCVVIGSRFHTANSAANENKVGVNLKMGVILTALVLNHHSEPLTTVAGCTTFWSLNGGANKDALPKMGAISLASFSLHSIDSTEGSGVGH